MTLDRQFCSVAEAATYLDIDPSSAYRMIREGRFPVTVVKVGSLTKVPLKPLLALTEQAVAS